jgi:hypothetical protein
MDDPSRKKVLVGIEEKIPIRFPIQNRVKWTSLKKGTALSG